VKEGGVWGKKKEKKTSELKISILQNNVNCGFFPSLIANRDMAAFFM